MDLKDWDVWNVKNVNENEVERVEGEPSVFGSQIDAEVRSLFADIETFGNEAIIFSEPLPSSSEPIAVLSVPIATSSPYKLSPRRSEPIGLVDKPVASSLECFTSSEPIKLSGEHFLSYSEPIRDVCKTVASSAELFQSSSEPVTSASKPFATQYALVTSEELFNLNFAPSMTGECGVHSMAKKGEVQLSSMRLENEHECQGCRKKYRKWESLYIHAKFKCPLATYRKKTFVCPVCLEFKSRQRMAAAVHVASHLKKPAYCPFCHIKIRRLSRLNHLLNHFIDVPDLVKEEIFE